ncbi:MAG: hypothetical protein VB137_04700, partial [Burkholderia sp.]
EVLPDARDVFDSSIFGFLRAYITASDRFCIPTVLVAAQRLTLVVAQLRVGGNRHFLARPACLSLTTSRADTISNPD